MAGDRPKRRKTVSLDPNVADAIDMDDDEFSPRVNEWARRYYIEDKPVDMDATHIDRMIQTIESREHELERKTAEIRDVLDQHKRFLKEIDNQATDE